MEVPLYAIADAFQMTFYHDNDEVVRGCSPRTIEVGPWKINLAMEATADQQEDDSVSLFLKIRKRLWCYVFSSVVDRRLHCVVFDQEKTSIKSAEAAKFATGLAYDTIDKLGDAVQACFSFDFKQGVWRKRELSDLVS